LGDVQVRRRSLTFPARIGIRAAKTSIIETPSSEGLEETCGFFLRLTRKVRTAADLFERPRYGVFRSFSTLASAPTLLTDGFGANTTLKCHCLHL